MNEGTIILQFLVSSFLAGLVATLVSTSFVIFVSKRSPVVIDPLAALGSIISVEHVPAPRVGMLLHLLAGTVFSIIYSLVLHVSPAHALFHFLLFGAAIGLLHGFVIFFVLVPPLAEHHPSKKVRAAGPLTALTYSSAHVLFGLTIGLVYGLCQSYFA